MIRTLRNLIVVVICVFSLPACNVFKNPTGPSGYDPSKPIDSDNRPPGPGPSVRASAEYGVYDVNGNRLESIGSSEACGSHLTGCETYALKQWTVYSTKLCVTHPGVPGRGIDMSVSSLGYQGSVRQKLTFDEGDPSKSGTVCVAVEFNSGSSDKGGSIKVLEFGQDLIDISEQFELWIQLDFQVQ